jgi:hypothetical protein
MLFLLYRINHDSFMQMLTFTTPHSLLHLVKVMPFLWTDACMFDILMKKLPEEVRVYVLSVLYSEADDYQWYVGNDICLPRDITKARLRAIRMIYSALLGSPITLSNLRRPFILLEFHPTIDFVGFQLEADAASSIFIGPMGVSHDVYGNKYLAWSNTDCKRVFGFIADLHAKCRIQNNTFASDHLASSPPELTLKMMIMCPDQGTVAIGRWLCASVAWGEYGDTDVDIFYLTITFVRTWTDHVAYGESFLDQAVMRLQFVFRHKDCIVEHLDDEDMDANLMESLATNSFSPHETIDMRPVQAYFHRASHFDATQAKSISVTRIIDQELKMQILSEMIL